MVFDIQSVPTLLIQALLPVIVNFFQFLQLKACINPAIDYAIRFHMLEMEHHIKFLLVVAYVVEGNFWRHHRSLANGHSIIFAPNFFKLLQKFVHARAVLVMLHTSCRRHQGETVGKSLPFADKGNNVLTETVNPLIKPKLHNIFYLFTNLGVVHIKVGLLDGEKVKVVFTPNLVVLPPLAGEGGSPVVGRLFTVFTPALSPNVIVLVGVVVATFSGLLKPLVLVACVVYNQVHNNPKPQGVSLFKYGVKVFHSAVFGVYVVIVGYVITIVVLRGNVQR